MTKLHVFDMDGTLLRGNSVEEISRRFGRFEQARALEQSYLRGEVSDEDGPQWWAKVYELWADATEEQMDAAFDGVPWMDRIADVFADITERGEHSVVISQSPLYVVRRLRRYGAQATYATMIEPGIPGTQEQLLTSLHKVEITERLLGEFGIAVKDCVAYGDSLSDMDLFKVLDHTVAVNADAGIRGLAAAEYDGTDFWSAYQLGRSLWDDADVDDAAPVACSAES